MAINPGIGESGGQHYPIVRSICNFLEQMAEGGLVIGAAVIKEIIQNADDAGASELAVILDERHPSESFPPEYHPLLQPALIIRNNAPFKTHDEVEADTPDDFKAICEVAGAHKFSRPTAAGRFGIGFNSVYFLTDTPVLFSRREVHIFDLLHRLFLTNGWRFPLDDFPTTSFSMAGPIKNILEWALPKEILDVNAAYGEIAMSGDDYKKTVFRLPLRNTPESTPALHKGRFGSSNRRKQLLEEMWEQSARSIIFLKSLRTVVFGVLRDKNVVEEWSRIEATPNTDEFDAFKNQVELQSKQSEIGRKVECGFYERSITISRSIVSDRLTDDDAEKYSDTWSFFVKHSARFDDSELTELRERLIKNRERAVPWVSIAIPKDPGSLLFDGNELPDWRVFLPLLEEGPSSCVFNAAFFVGPSRQRIEFQTDGSDEALRKTKWNQLLVERALVPLLQDASADVLDIVPALAKEHPKDYLSLFPLALKKNSEANSFTEYFRQRFSDNWILHLFDIWEKAFDLWVGGSSDSNQIIESIPNWLKAYQDRFKHLSTGERHFVDWTLGEALRDRVGDSSGISVQRNISSDVIVLILTAEEPPDIKDLRSLLERIQPHLTKESLQGHWAFQQLGGAALRFDRETYYLLGQEEDEIHDALRNLGLQFEQTEWVESDVGLAAIDSFKRRNIDNVLDADNLAALKLLRRVKDGSHHDSIANHRLIIPIIDFLCRQDPDRLSGDLQLAFLVKTVENKVDRRHLGTIFLKLEKLSPDDEAVWNGLFRRVFPEVEPNCAPHLRRLIKHAPNLVDSLSSEDCRLEILNSRKLLDVLHRSRIAFPESFETFCKELNSDKQPAESEKTAKLIIEEADGRWDELDEELRFTVLALPIHRTAKGEFVPLVKTDGSDIEQVQVRFRLQSEDALHDAPIDLPNYELLHSTDRFIYRFYRQQFNLEEHGRVAVLKECLRQIGNTDENANQKLLKYIAKYYKDALEYLSNEVDVYHNDEKELQQLFKSAKTVPCVDGEWRNFAVCIEGSDVADILREQGWKEDAIDAMMSKLAFPKPVATTEPSLKLLVQQLHQLPRLATPEIPQLAITSESDDFSLQERCKVITDNFESIPRGKRKRASVLDAFMCPALGGKTRLDSLELVDTSRLDLRDGVRRCFFPNAADLSACATVFGISTEDVPKILIELGVPRKDLDKINKRIVGQFSEIWPKLSDTARLNLLAYVGAKQLTQELAEQVHQLNVIHVSPVKPTWRHPKDVVSPEWCKTQPPHLLLEQRPNTEGVDSYVLQVWNEWCGLNNLRVVVHAVVAATAGVSGDKQTHAWKQLTEWLNRVSSLDSLELSELADSLRNQSWVLAGRKNNCQFHRASETILHTGADVLAYAFWIVEGDLPTFAQKTPEDYGFQASPPPTSETIVNLVDCLSHSEHASSTVVQSVYHLTADLINQRGNLKKAWLEQTRKQAVYRLFRTPERYSAGQDIFIGDEDYSSDFGELLWCLKANDTVDSTIAELYQALGINQTPSVEQIVTALLCLKGTAADMKELHARLVNLLTAIPINEHQLSMEDIRHIRVLACSGTYEPICCCYRGRVLGKPELLSEQSRFLVLDTRDEPTKKIVGWLEDGLSGVVKWLEDEGQAELVRRPHQVNVAASISTITGPWDDWFSQLASEGTALREEASEALNLVFPQTPFRLIPVDNIPIRYVLPNGDIVEPLEDWKGPPAFHEAKSQIFIRKNWLERDYLGRPDKLKDFDRLVTEQVFELLQLHTKNQISLERFLEFVNQTLERPGVFLERIRREKREHLFHQYRDGVANPEFEELFDGYRRLSSRATAKKGELEKKMLGIVHRDSVRNRREQIRGYGYDKFSVFAELVQNAEDAYAQRAVLGLDEPPEWAITFRYVSCPDGMKLLVVEHFGRPFNEWQHGSRREESFRKDVEGVLRSSGSFKPHAGSDKEVGGPIGRFGLGFKSVYLLTERPRIHSGHWHFEIESGCIPWEVAPPEMPTGATRIQLPLLENDAEEREEAGERLINLMPFLRRINRITLQNSNGSSLNLSGEVIGAIPCKDAQLKLERVEIKGVGHVKGGSVHLIRIRHAAHDGQLAVYLNSNGMPASWGEAFNRDTFVVLPLRVKLGCGVGVSHLFELQSGRTNLIDLERNQIRFDEVAGLMRGLPEALHACAGSDIPLYEVMMSFWRLWHWGGGDSELLNLRQVLARELIYLAQTETIVPTHDAETCIALQRQPVFSFVQIPLEFEEELIKEAVEIPLEDRIVPLRADNVVPRRFLSYYKQACVVAEYKEPVNLPNQVGWKDIGTAFLERHWLAELPGLVSVMARTIKDDFEQISEWLKGCKLRAIDENGAEIRDVAGNLFAPNFPGDKHLPAHKLRRLHQDYDEHAVKLLNQVGLQSALSAQQIGQWVRDGLERDECIGILSYLAEAGRWRQDKFYQLGDFLSQQMWFEGDFNRLTTVEAFSQELIPDEILEDENFRTWLRIIPRAEEPQIQPEPTPPLAREPRQILNAIYDWWHEEGETLTREQYERKLYLDGKPPVITTDFFERDIESRKQWFTLFLLGFSHTMGRTILEQHRSFLRLCEQNGWLDVFANPSSNADDWLRVLDDYLEEQIEESVFYHWMKQFITIYQLARWLPEYVESFLDINRLKERFRRLDQITITRANEEYQGGGLDAPPIARALGIGACFVLRELVRTQVINSRYAYSHCFVPVKRVRDFFIKLGCENISNEADVRNSLVIYDFLKEHLGSEKATFDLSFDLPFLIIHNDSSRRRHFFGDALEDRGNYITTGVNYTSDPGDFVTLWDGRVIPRSYMK